MDLVNQVYNSLFNYPNEMGNFPDGWDKSGGDQTTIWKWLEQEGESRAIEIEHPGGPKAGIMQAVNVPVQAGENQRWELRITLNTEPAGVPVYARIYLGAVQQLAFSLTPSAEPQTFNKVLATPVGTTALRIEAGILGQGKLVIYDISAYRLYPLRVLRLDDKGQIYVRHVESVGQIQGIVPVKIMGPVPPVNVEVHADVTGDIRNLTPAQDGVRVYSSSGNNILSSPDGSMLVRIAGRKFIDYVENVEAASAPQPSSARDVSNYSVYSFAVLNTGSEAAQMNLEVSPEGTVWSVDTQAQTVSPGELSVFTPNRFLRFNRLVYRASIPTSLTIWFQGQS
ncbi:DUF6385 domain-containing protein [Desulfosporosinus sp. PR]|uniref:DUF6385 domain-containing protein n=1 Tax=Candidatus Desulfosporosinus nitrosoreducens TaxID=3401928 RepID=UPI0027E87311|nr:DUF6385 domain-containing protein [Desulfosporosinus sp. PR]MDQ7097171.1 DUF6385 domain-containing protein [Desulfosporosinus sp. PR]